MKEKVEYVPQDSTKPRTSLDRRNFVIAATSAALSLRLSNTLRADDEGESEERESEMFLDAEAAAFLAEHGILQEWYAVAEEVQKLFLRDEESETIISVPPKSLTPKMIARIREDYIHDGHLVCDDGSFVFRLNIAVPTVRGRVSFGDFVDVQMLVSLEREVNVTVDDDDTVVATSIYREKSEHVPFGISIVDATGKEVGAADANRNNIATVDSRNVDLVQPLHIAFRPRKTLTDLKKSTSRGISPYDDETLG